MDFTVIDINSWERREHFEHYLSSVPCTYSMTVRLDITNLRKQDLRLYPTMLYLLTKTVNQFDQFRMAFNSSGQLVLYSRMEPCYTVFHKDTETFSNLWTLYSDDYTVFLRRYEEDLQTFGNEKAFLAKPGVPENSFTVSALPWTTFESFHLNTTDFRYLIPIFTIGKYFQQGDRIYLPLAVQVHHSVCDGFHVCRFVNKLQSEIDAIQPNQARE